MPDPLSPIDLIQQQSSDYRQVLAAAEALLAAELSEQAVSAFLSRRAELLQRIDAREGELARALEGASCPEPVLTGYRELLEQVIATEARITEAASTLRGVLQQQLKQLGTGYRALSGYRQPQRGDTARAISRRA